MSSVAEETAFEQWMLSEMALCKDLAEFAAFALALRGGALAGSPVAPTTTSSEGEVSLDIPEDTGGSRLPLLAGVVVVVVVLALAAVFLMGG